MLSPDHARTILELADDLADTAALNYGLSATSADQEAEDTAQRALTDFVLSLVVDFADA